MDKIEEVVDINPNGDDDTMAKITAEGNCQVILCEFKENNTYTITFWVKGVGNVGFCMETETLISVTSTDEWQKVSHTFQGTKGLSATLSFTEGTYYIYNAMLERGNIATDYEQAPEDITEEYTSLISQTAEKIDLIVSSSSTSSELVLTDKAIEVISDNIILNGNTTIGEGFVLTADNIDSKNLVAEKIEVKDSSGNTTFKADAENNNVYIGGYTVSNNKLSAQEVEDTITYSIDLSIDGVGIKSVTNDGTSAVTTIQGNVRGGGITYSKTVGGTTGSINSSFSADKLAIINGSSGMSSGFDELNFFVNKRMGTSQSVDAYVNGSMQVTGDLTFGGDSFAFSKDASVSACDVNAQVFKMNGGTYVFVYGSFTIPTSSANTRVGIATIPDAAADYKPSIIRPIPFACYSPSGIDSVYINPSKWLVVCVGTSGASSQTVYINGFYKV